MIKKIIFTEFIKSEMNPRNEKDASVKPKGRRWGKSPMKESLHLEKPSAAMVGT